VPAADQSIDTPGVDMHDDRNNGGDMIGRIQLVVVGCLILASTARAAEPNRFEYTEPHMGVPFKLVFYAGDQGHANKAARAAFDRIAELNGRLSDYDPQSELTGLSRTAGSGKTVALSDDLWTVLLQAQRLAEQSEGAFDVTVGPYVRLWRRARRTGEMPREVYLRSAADAVGYRHLKLDPDSRAARLNQPEMRLDLGGIAKGYAADEALAVLREHGVQSALVDASGDIATGDPPPGRAGWRIGIAPLEPEAAPSRYLELANMAVATSGDTWQYVEIEGKRYSHIVDPKTGLGLTRRSSVTIIAPDGMTADSLASAVSVLGPERGIALVEATERAEALLLWREDDELRSARSSGFSTYVVDEPSPAEAASPQR
jgi:thiamine biosynthesis lipoprotein